VSVNRHSWTSQVILGQMYSTDKSWHSTNSNTYEYMAITIFEVPHIMTLT